MRFELHSLWPVQRQRPDGSVLNQVVFSVLQHRRLKEDDPESPENWGGCTVIVDLGRDDGEGAIRYLIRKPLFDQDKPGGRIFRAKKILESPAMTSLAGTYGMDDSDEPFAMLHTGH